MRCSADIRAINWLNGIEDSEWAFRDDYDIRLYVDDGVHDLTLGGRH